MPLPVSVPWSRDQALQSSGSYKMSSLRITPYAEKDQAIFSGTWSTGCWVGVPRMAAVSGAARVAVWVVAVVAAATSVFLIVSLVVNPEMADRSASVTGAVVSLVMLVLAVVALASTSPSGSGGRRVDAGRGGVAAGGDVVGNAIGERSTVIAPPSTPRPGAGESSQTADVRAEQNGIAAAGDVRDNALGDDSERR